MYQSHLLGSTAAADRMREQQARLQRKITDGVESRHQRRKGPRRPIGWLRLVTAMSEAIRADRS